MQRSPTVVKELGTAFAVLAIYVLTLLVPLHQSSATQRDFARLGYETIGAWSICSEFGTVDNTGDRDGGELRAMAKCPASGIQQFGDPVRTIAALTSAAMDMTVVRLWSDVVGASGPVPHVGQSRAPPRSV